MRLRDVHGGLPTRLRRPTRLIVTVIAVLITLPAIAKPANFKVVKGYGEEFGFKANPGTIKVKVTWQAPSAGKQIIVELYGPSNIFATTKGTSGNLTLTKQVTNAQLQGKVTNTLKNAGVNCVVRIRTPYTSAVNGTVTVGAPALALLKTFPFQTQQMSPQGAVMFHLLNRYANNASNKNTYDTSLAILLGALPQALKTALPQMPQMPSPKQVLKELATPFNNMSLARKQQLMGSTWANKQLSSPVTASEMSVLSQNQGFKYPVTGKGVRGTPVLASSSVPSNQEGWANSGLKWLSSFVTSSASIGYGPILVSAGGPSFQFGFGPRYRIDWVGFYCERTTWLPGADEPYFIFAMTNGLSPQYNAVQYPPGEPPFRSYNKKSGIYSDINDGVARKAGILDPTIVGFESILFGFNGPWLPPQQPPPPQPSHDVGIEVFIMESDEGAIQALQYFWGILGAINQAITQYAPNATTDWVYNVANNALKPLFDAGNDDEINRGMLIFTPQTLEALANSPKLQKNVSNVMLQYKYEWTPNPGPEWWNDALYRLYFDVTKIP